MDLRLFGRVMRRFGWLIGAGVLVAAVLATLSYFRVELHGSAPSLKPRTAEVYQANATILLSRTNCPLAETSCAVSAGALIGLAPLYARIANGDGVKKLVIRACRGHLPGSYNLIPAADTSYGSVSGLPGLLVFGKANSSRRALRVTGCAASGFLRYLNRQQQQANVRPSARLDATLLNAPSNASLIIPRKKTLPIVVFLGVLFATLAMAFVLENARPRPAVRELASTPYGNPERTKDLGRSA